MKALSQEGIRNLFEKTIFQNEHKSPIAIFYYAPVDYQYVSLKLREKYETQHIGYLIFSEPKDLRRCDEKSVKDAKFYVYRPCIEQFEEDRLRFCEELYEKYRKPVIALFSAIVGPLFYPVPGHPVDEKIIEELDKRFDVFLFTPTVIEWLDEIKSKPHNTAVKTVVDFVESTPDDEQLRPCYYEIIKEIFSREFINIVKSGEYSPDVLEIEKEDLISYLTHETVENRELVRDTFEKFINYVKKTPIAWMVDSNVSPDNLGIYANEI